MRDDAPHDAAHDPRPPRAPEGSPPRSSRGRDAPVDPLRAGRAGRDPRARDPGLRVVHRVLGHLPGRLPGAPDPRGLRPPGLRSGGGWRPRWSGVGRAVVLRSPPPRPLRHRRGHHRHGPRRRRHRGRRARRGRGGDGGGGPDRRTGDRGRAGPHRRQPGRPRAWSPSGSPTTRRSGRRSPTRKRSPSPRRPASSRRRTPASWRGRHRCGARSTPSTPTGSSTGSARSRTRSW